MLFAAIALLAAIDAQVWVAIIGLPANLLAAAATLYARRADRAVNHRITNTTISQDVADMKVQLAQVGKDIIWLTHAFSQHLRSHVDGQAEGE